MARSRFRWSIWGATFVLLVGLAIWVRIPANSPTPEYLRASPESLEWFQDAKFGLLINWGPVSLAGTDIGWSRRGPRRGQDKSEQEWGTIPFEEYDNLYRRFNPVQFDATRLVELAQTGGAKYLIWLTKHHDGFCMFDSSLTEYKITNSPIHRDLTAEIADACHKAGMRLGFYYSPVDWYHPDYQTAGHHRYIEYLHGQLRELCTKYGRVDLIWFDGLFWRARDWDAENLFKLIRELQPGVLINDRADLPGDFDTIEFEQKIGPFDTRRVWESCFPMGEQWSYKPGDTYKSAAECIRWLMRCAGAGGNTLLAIGPTPEGTIEPEQVQRLQEIGAWLSTHGQSVYGTRAGPFLPADWGVSMHRGKTVFLHVLDPAAETITLPGLTGRITAASMLTGGAVQVDQGDGTRIVISPMEPDAIDAVVELQFDMLPDVSAGRIRE